MLWINPERVTLTIGTEVIALDGVTRVSVDRRAERLVVEHSDLGRHVAFADVAEERMSVRVARTVEEGSAGLSGSVMPGGAGTLAWRSAASNSDGRGSVVSAGVVVIAVEHEHSAKRGLEQTITMIGVSPDGAADPVEETEEA